MHGDDDFDDFFGPDGSTRQTEEDGGDHESKPLLPPRLGLLSNVSPKELDEVARSAQLKHLDSGVVVFAQGDVADRFFILVDGEVEVDNDGKVIATLGAGSFFGEGALLSGGLRTATIRTSAPSSIWSVDYKTFRDVVSHHLLSDPAAAREAQSRLARVHAQDLH